MGHTRGILACAVALGAPLAVAACLGTTELGRCSGGVPTHAYAVGDTAADTLTSGRCRHLYQFSVASQANVRFRLSSPGLQTFLQLYDHRGAIVMNSALSTTLDTATTVRMMLGTGDYALAVNPVTAGQGGTFRLATVTDTGAVSGCAAIWVTTGIATTQTITTADCTQGPAGTSYYAHVYDLVLLQGQEVNLSETATAFPPALLLSGPGGSIPSTPDSTGTKASLLTLVLTQGAYSLWVGSSSASQTGKYTLQVN